MEPDSRPKEGDVSFKVIPLTQINKEKISELEKKIREEALAEHEKTGGVDG